MVRMVLFAIALCVALASQPGHARKVALVIANSDYAHASPLANPKNDAALVADAARAAQFDDVTVIEDAGIDAFETALREFAVKADGAEVAMVYFAGHGIEGRGQNWLIPVDAKLESDRDLPFEAIELSLVTDSMAGAQVRMVVLDACRNNPFGNRWKSGSRAITRGLAPVEADDFIVIFAAAPGQTAADGAGKNSPFATSLAERLPQADLPLQLLGGSVRDDVLRATGGEQRPFVSASVTGTPIYLVPRTASGVAGRSIRFVVENVVVTSIKPTTGIGEDEIYLLASTGERVPEMAGDKFDLDKGDSWAVGRSFTSIAPITLTVMEDDPIGDDDNLGMVNTGTAEGSFTQTLRQDGGEFTVSYDLRLAD